MQIIFTIPDDKLQRIIDAINGIYPVPFLADIEDPESPGIPEFSPQQWAKERVRRFIVDTVHRYEQIIAINQAKENTPPDDELAT